MATPTELKKIDGKKMAAQKKHVKQEKDQLLPLTGMVNAPSAHLLVSGNPNQAPRMMDLQPLGGAKNSAQLTQSRQPTTVSAGLDFSSDQQHLAMQNQNYMSFAENQQQQYKDPEPDNMNMMAFSQLQIGPMPMRPLTAGLYGNNNGGRGGGRVYRQRREGPMPPAKLRPQLVENVPPGAKTVQYTVRTNNVVCFHGKGHFLSTMYPTKILVDGHEYPSVEHYYQACKIFSLIGGEQAQVIRMIEDPLKAKSKTREIMSAWNVPNSKIEQWKNSHGLIVILHAMRHKFNQHDGLRDKLLATDDALLCQAYDRDSLFAVGMTEEQFREWARENNGKVLTLPEDLTEDNIKYLPMMGKGKNALGVLCMQVRKQIRDSETGNPPPTPPNDEDEEKEGEKD